ncbi:MAG: hypothetical protein VCB43_02620 [Myxococcota bacterium]
MPESAAPLTSRACADSDDLVLMYLGFAQDSGAGELDESLEALNVQRDDPARMTRRAT